MALNPEQALDESTYRRVEGAFDELRRAARNIEASAVEIESEGGEQRLADLLHSVAAETQDQLGQTMSEAYFDHASGERQISLLETDSTPDT